MMSFPERGQCITTSTDSDANLSCSDEPVVCECVCVCGTHTADTGVSACRQRAWPSHASFLVGRFYAFHLHNVSVACVCTLRVDEEIASCDIGLERTVMCCRPLVRVL